MIEPGQPAPDFTLTDQRGKDVSLSDFRGKAVVLYFYPRDNTPGCTLQACAFRDMHGDFRRADAIILGISPDDAASHKKFAAKRKLPFTLLADPDKRVCQSYGVWKEKKLYGRTFIGLERTTFVIDRDGVVARVFPRVRVLGHAKKVFDAVAALP